MKELKLLTEWADSVINEFSKDSNLPIDQDPIKRTQINNPHLSREEAASKYLSDITQNFLDQNTVINAQRRENDKLKKTVSDLAKEVNDIEQDSGSTHGELERLKTTSGQLKTDIQNRKITQNEVNDILAKAKEISTKPGMSDEQYQELKRQVAEFKKDGVDPKKFEEFKNRLERMSTQKSVDKGDFERLQALMSKVEQGQAEVERGRGDMNSKIADIEKRQAEIEQREKNHEQEVAQKIEKAQSERLKAENRYRKYTQTVGKRMEKLEPRVDAIVKDLPDQTELARLKTLPAEIEIQKEINKYQDRKDAKHDEILKRQSDGLNDQQDINNRQNKIIDNLIGRLFNKSKHPETIDTSWDEVRLNSRSHDREWLNTINDPISDKRRLATKKTSPKTNHPSITDGPTDNAFKKYINSRINTEEQRIERLLSKVEPYSGEKKTTEKKRSDLRKVNRILSGITNDVMNRYRTSEVVDGAWDSGDMYKYATTLLDDRIRMWAAKLGLDKNMVSYEISKSKTAGDKKHDNFLPESISTDLESLAENILGQQYTKYIK